MLCITGLQATVQILQDAPIDVYVLDRIIIMISMARSRICPNWLLATEVHCLVTYVELFKLLMK